MNTMRRLAPLVPRSVILVSCLPLLACYEEPVRDHLHIAFGPGPVVIVTAVRDIASPETAGDNRAVENRLDQARSDLEGGWDRWSRSFPELGALADRSTLVRDEGRPSRAIHSALLSSFRPVERLLGNEGLGAFLDRSGGTCELQLYPTGSGQATRQQRETFERHLGAWSEAVAAYLDSATGLYEYLAGAPDRAIPCLSHIFDDHPDASGPLTEGEAELVTDLKSRIERVAEVLMIPDGEAYSLNELSRLVFDTFQGRLTVTLDGTVVELEGFTDRTNYLERPPVDLWRSLDALTERWLAPDLVTALVAPGPESAQPDTDPVAFASLPRRWTPAPDAGTVETGLRALLRPEELYRVRWRPRPAPTTDEEIVLLAIDRLTSAERDLPD